jgi:twitching motility protein PilT
MNAAIANLIRKNETNKIPSTMQVSRRQGMVTLDDNLIDLVKRDVVTREAALDAAQSRSDLEARLG